MKNHYTDEKTELTAFSASNNLADTVNGLIIGGIYNGAGLNFHYVRATSAYDCKHCHEYTFPDLHFN